MKRKTMMILAEILVTFAICMAIFEPTNASTSGNSVSKRIIERKQKTNIVFVQSSLPDITYHEYELLLRVCMSECGGEYGEPLVGKIAVVETILNRCELYGEPVEAVVNKPSQYSMADNGEPDYTVIQAVDIALRENIFPDDMIYFKSGEYHNFGEPYMKIGNHYFSLKEE